MKKFLRIPLFLLLILICAVSIAVQGQKNNKKNENLAKLQLAKFRDSLDAVIYPIPELLAEGIDEKNVEIKSQEEWDEIPSLLKDLLKAGANNIRINVTGCNLVFGKVKMNITDLNYPQATIRIAAKKATMIPYGISFSREHGANVMQNGRSFWSMPYTEFGLNDMVIDGKGNEIPIRGEARQVEGEITKVKDDIWRFRIKLSDLREEQCKDFYVLMTRDWTSARHKVVMVKDGWLYYQLDSDDLHDTRNPNVDWNQYQVRPRYRLINCPVSEGIHTTGGMIYIPKQYKEIRINKGGQVLNFDRCHLKCLEITGFDVNGCGEGTPIGIYNSTFEMGAFIHGNKFHNLSSFAIGTAFNTNVSIYDNEIKNTRTGAIYGDGDNVSVHSNRLHNIGWMFNSGAIVGGGRNLHICDNIIEDFNYSAITCGSRRPNTDGTMLTFIFERNTIRYSKNYTNNKLSYTLADGGAIYVGPQCTRGIVRNNVICNYDGINSNRGIFLDDGCKNLAIYGNLIMNTANSYDIDLRRDGAIAARIPDHNTHNSVFHNIMTGGYRFQEKDAESDCVGGANILLGTGNFQIRKINLTAEVGDMEMEGCKVKGGQIIIPRKNKEFFDSVHADSFVLHFIKFQ